MSKPSILVVDDEAKMRRLLGLMLERLGYEVLSAGDGEAALACLNEQPVDLVITDLRMPRMDGMTLLRTLREEDNQVAVIVVTAHGAVESAVEAMKYGASDYIVRPFELEAIEAAVERALRLGQVQRENRFLRSEVEKGWSGFVGTSAAMRSVYRMIAQVGPTKTSVLIQGETGTGKELAARAIHRASPRADALFVPINCAAIPADILESELFGYSKGAFTGANKDRVGKFELASGGTIFLDEITEMDINIQAKLLRALQERTIERLGSNQTISIDIRVIGASNRNALEAVKAKKLREDLYYRLNVFTIELPPLRERRDDIEPLANFFLEKHAAELGCLVPTIDAPCRACLEGYDWPGNVRELENMMERAIVLSGGKTIGIEHLSNDIDRRRQLRSDPPLADSNGLALQPQVEEMEKQLIRHALSETGDNKSKAAQLLKISERSLWYKLKKYRI